MARRLVVAGLTLAVAAGVAVGAVAQRGGSDQRLANGPKSSPPASDRVYYAEADHVSRAGLDGRPLGVATTALFHRVVPTDPVWPSPDRRWLLLADGELVDLSAERPMPPVQAIPLELVVGPGGDFSANVQPTLATNAPWADHGRRLVVGYGGRVTSVELATGTSTLLGKGLLPAGDPVGNGAAYVVDGPAPDLHARGQQDFFLSASAPVDRIVLATAGGRPRTLTSGPQLVAALHGPSGATVVASHMAFSADGSRLAVELALFDGSRRSGAVVVLDRRGGVVGVSPTAFGHGRTWLAWSPKENLLAFGFPGGPQSITGPPQEFFLDPQLWHPGAGDARELMRPNGRDGLFDALSCLWSPNGTQLICGDSNSWPIVTVAGRQVRKVETVPGQALVWVPAYAGGSRHG